MNTKKNIHIFSDFDGTITSNDVGVMILNKFAIGNWQKYEERLDELSIREMLTKEWELFRGTKKDIIDTIVPRVKIISGFKAFYDYIKQKYKFTIVSDGFYFYINNILKKKNILNDNNVEIIANEVIENQKKKTFTLSFANEPCEHGCANCKTSHLLKAKKHGQYIIYIGDGVSDFQPALHADVVFAKENKDLIAYLEKNEVSHYPFNNFNDIDAWFKNHNNL